MFAVSLSTGLLMHDVCYFILLPLAGLALFFGLQVVKMKKAIVQLSKQFLPSGRGKFGLMVHGLSTKFSQQEETLALALKEIERLGSNNDHPAKNIQGALGESLKTLRMRLEDFRLQESQQAWMVRGRAELAAIKGNELSPEEYASKIIYSLVKYVGANQGVFYEANEAQQTLKLLAAYAYGSKKCDYKDLVIDMGDGMLGQSLLERDIIYLTDIPKNYVKITSGLGDATPRCIAIAPLFYRGQAFGVIELASFKAFESHEKDFLSQATGIIASELSSLKVQFQTKLLLEQAREQANQLGSQEEELRQSMEEMASTHEEMKRSAMVLEEKLAEIEFERAKNQAILESCADGVISFDESGRIEFSNAAAQDIFGLVKEEMFDKTVESLFGIHINYDQADRPKLLSKTGNEITSRTEVNSHDRFGNEISLLLTSAFVKVEGKTMFTLFAQKISVDLF